MFSIIVGQSRTPAQELPLTGQLSQLAGTPTQYILPSNLDVAAVKDNLIVLVGHILTEYFPALVPFSKVFLKQHSSSVFS